jgi:predicted O-linked N-acetylglucosamine transferase (SPINDLY family)/glycosyltransferase involved in cell wall biosynthesis
MDMGESVPLDIRGPRIRPRPEGAAPFWSVMIPVYNRGAYLEGAIRGVLEQDPGPKEMQIEVVDDCSTEIDFEPIVREVGRGRVDYYRQPINLGLIGNWNALLNRARGRWVHMLHDDDRVLPGFYSSLRGGLEMETDVGMAFCRHGFIDEHDRATFVMPPERETPGVLENFIEKLGAMQRIQFASVVVRRDAVEALGGFRPDLYFAADWELWKRLAAHFKTWYEPRTLAFYRRHGGSETSRVVRAGRTTADLRRAIEASRAYLPGGKVESITSQAKQYYVADAMGLLQQACARGDLEAAIHHAREGLLLDNSPNVVQFIAEGWRESAEQLAKHLTETVQRSLGPESTGQEAVYQMRRQMAEGWLASPLQHLEALFAGGFNRVQALLVASGLKAEGVPGSDKEFVDGLVKAVNEGLKSSGLGEPKTIAALLAAMLYLRPDEVLTTFDLPIVPAWFLQEYLRFIHEQPQLFNVLGASEQYGKFMHRWVAYLHEHVMAEPQSELWRNAALYFVHAGNFIPLYFNRDHLNDFHSRRGDLIERVLKSLGHQIDYSFPARPTRRIRVGIVNGYFSAQTETFHTLPAFEELDPEKFEVVLFTLGRSGDAVEAYCRSRAERFVELLRDLPAQVAALRAEDLDAVITGSNVTAVTSPILLLLTHRVARIQCTLFGSPASTGVPNMDIYISGRMSEPERGAQEHYRERLFMLDGPGFCFTYPKVDGPPLPVVTREALGIPEDVVVFASGSNFYKITPELESTWLKVLQAVPNSKLLLYPFSPSWSNAYPITTFMRRLVNNMAALNLDVSRLVVLPGLAGREEVKSYLRVADVYLDSFPHSGSHSLYDPLELGIPAVAMDGDNLRGRHGGAMIRDLGLPEWVAADEAGYVEAARKLGTDRALRATVRERILKGVAKPARFIDPKFYSGQIGQMLEQLIAEWRPR